MPQGRALRAEGSARRNLRGIAPSAAGGRDVPAWVLLVKKSLDSWLFDEVRVRSIVWVGRGGVTRGTGSAT